MYFSKQDYESPTTAILELRSEGSILITSDPLNNPDNAYDSLWDLGEI